MHVFNILIGIVTSLHMAHCILRNSMHIVLFVCFPAEALEAGDVALRWFVRRRQQWLLTGGEFGAGGELFGRH